VNEQPGNNKRVIKKTFIPAELDLQISSSSSFHVYSICPEWALHLWRAPRQDSSLKQLEWLLQYCVRVFAKSRILQLGDNILQTL